MPNNLPLSAASFTQSRDEARLVNEKNNLHGTKIEYNTGVNMKVR
jgi:hypothetical protein